MIKRVKMFTLLSVLAAALSACTISPPSGEQASVIPKAPESRAEKIEKRGFLVGDELKSIPFISTLDSWGYLDSKALWVEARPRRYYLIMLNFPCSELSFTQSIGFKARLSQLMPGDDVVVRGPPVRNCKIDKIYEMTRPRKSGKADESDEDDKE